jgi:hypothetical protein
MEETENLLTTAQAGRRLELCPDAVRDLARRGKLKPAMIVGRGQRLFTLREVERLRTERTSVRK